MEKMLYMLQEAQNIKRSAEQKLQETEVETLALHRKVETLEQSIKDVYHTLSEKQCEHSSVNNKDQNSQTLQSLAYVNEDLIRNSEKLQEEHFSVSTTCHLEIMIITISAVPVLK